MDAKLPAWWVIEELRNTLDTPRLWDTYCHFAASEQYLLPSNSVTKHQSSQAIAQIKTPFLQSVLLCSSNWELMFQTEIKRSGYTSTVS